MRVTNFERHSLHRLQITQKGNEWGRGCRGEGIGASEQSQGEGVEVGNQSENRLGKRLEQGAN